MLLIIPVLPNYLGQSSYIISADNTLWALWQTVTKYVSLLPPPAYYNIRNVLILMGGQQWMWVGIGLSLISAVLLAWLAQRYFLKPRKG